MPRGALATLWAIVALSVGRGAPQGAAAQDSVAAVRPATGTDTTRPAAPTDTAATSTAGAASPGAVSPGAASLPDSARAAGFGSDSAQGYAPARADTTAPAPTAADTSRSGGGRADSALAGAGGVRPDSTRPDSTRPDTARPNRAGTDTARAAPVRNTVPDTSLTARMDARRGGGLRRDEFPDLLTSARMTGSYHTFLDLVARANWGQRLGGAANYTLLAPTDSAFRAVAPEQLEAIRADTARLTALLRAHTAEGSFTTADLARQGTVRTLDGSVLTVARDSSGVYRVGGARLIRPDLMARDGVLHGVDRLLRPAAPAATSSPARERPAPSR